MSLKSPSAASPKSGGGPSNTEPKPNSVPVFIENTREQFLFPLDKGAATKVTDLAKTLAKKFNVPQTVLTFKVHRLKIGTDLRLCTFPDGTVIQCYIDSDMYQPITMSSPASNMTSARSNASMFVGAGSSDMHGGGGGGGGDVPSVISDTSSLKPLDLTQNYAGTNASVDLMNTSRSYATTVDPNDPSCSVLLPQPSQLSKVKLISINVKIEECDAVTVTVESDSCITDLRIRCKVSFDDYPTSSVDGRRVLFEQRSFAEQCIGAGASIVFHKKRAGEWDDEDMVLPASRLVRASGGKGIAVDSPNVPSARRLQSSPARNNTSALMMNRSNNNVGATTPSGDAGAAAAAAASSLSVSRRLPSNAGMSPVAMLSPNDLTQYTQIAREEEVLSRPNVSPLRNTGGRYQNFNPHGVTSSPVLNVTRIGGGAGGGGGDPSMTHYNNIVNHSRMTAVTNQTHFNNTTAGGGGQASPGDRFSSLALQAPNHNNNESPRARNPKELLSSARKRKTAGPPDAPLKNAWISPTHRPEEYATPEYEAAKHGCGLSIRFEDPTDDCFTHTIRVWSLNPVDYLFTFAGPDAQEIYHLLCNGTIVLQTHLSFAVVTKGENNCLFSFARK